MKASDIEKLPFVSVEQVSSLKQRDVVWMKWDSPGQDGKWNSQNYAVLRHLDVFDGSGHNEWFSASIGKPVAGHSSASNHKKMSSSKRKTNKRSKRSKASQSKAARVWKGWFQLEFTSFICASATAHALNVWLILCFVGDEPFDLCQAAKQLRLRKQALIT